jgi:cytochrome P450
MTVAGDYQYPSPEVIECPFPFYGALREADPLYQLPTGEYMVSRYEDIVHVARHPELFSNFIGPVNEELVRLYATPAMQEGLSTRFTPYPVVFSDPPEHKLKRSLCLSIVSRERLLEYEPMIRGLVDALIDAFIEDGRCEFSSQFAVPLPRSVILRIFDVPPADEAQLLSWLSSEGVGSRMLPLEAKEEQGARRAKAREYFKALVVQRHEHPVGDFLSDVVTLKYERDGDLDLSYLAGEVSNLYGAATGSTGHSLANAMLKLVQHPDQLELIRADRALIRPMIDEVLRLESPVQWLQRIATQDTEVRGTSIPKDSVVLIVFAAGNRDPDRFPEPDEFRIDRPHVARDQLAFGQGTHRCIGAALARLEAKVAFEQLITRLENLRLAPGHEDPPHIPQFNHRAPTEVQIEFEPATRSRGV